MSFKITSEKDTTSTTHNLKLAGHSEIQIRLNIENASETKQDLTNVENFANCTSTPHNLKLSGHSKIQIHHSRENASEIKQDLTNVENFANWPDIVFCYYDDTDNFAVYLIRATPGVIYYCDNATDDILVSYTRDDKIVSIDIDGISTALQCHMFDVKEVVNGKPPLTLNTIYYYYEDLDTLKIYFDHMPFTSNNSVKTDIEDIEVERDNMGRITCILFRNAKERISKPISEEEREKLERISKEEAVKIEKWSNEIVKQYL